MFQRSSSHENDDDARDAVQDGKRFGAVPEDLKLMFGPIHLQQIDMTRVDFHAASSKKCIGNLFTWKDSELITTD